MSDAPQAADPVAEPAPADAVTPPDRPAGRRRRAIWRWTRRLFAVLIAVLVALFVSFFSIDLGRYPGLKSLAEREASKYLERPMHIGSLHALITPGEFELRDVVIEGKNADGNTANALPFFTAKRIIVHVPWWTLFKSRIEVEVTLKQWKMVIETFPGRGHNLPKLVPKTKSTGPPRFRTTVRFAYAQDGEFVFNDHGTPWSVTAPNLNFELVRAENLKAYVGKAQFTGGTVQIQKFLPMSADMTTRFVLDGGKVQLRHIDLVTDGARSHVTGNLDFGNWPEQLYNVSSTVDFPRMREIFFANESWRLTGEGEFAGIFRLFKAGGHDLSGQFSGQDVSVNGWQFPDLHGSLVWQPTRFVVTHADSKFVGGDLRFSYGMEPLGTKQGATARLNAEYVNVDLGAFTKSRNIDWTVLEPQGRMSGRVDMVWPNGKFSTGLQGEGQTTIDPTGPVASVALPPLDPQRVEAEEPARRRLGEGGFDPARPPGRFPLAAQARYRFTGDSLDFEPSTAATPSTFVAFSGHALGGPIKVPFHVTSHDWQESDRLFAAIMAEFAQPTGAIEVGGRGTFDGEITRTFRSPRIEGRFVGEQLRAWNVEWGRTSGDLVIEDGFMDIKGGVVLGANGATMRTDGRYSLGYKPDVDEINSRIVLQNWPLTDLRRAFGLNDWPVDGIVGAADLQLRGQYRGPHGAGTMRIDRGLAWDEPFESATASLAFEGDGLRISRIEMTKGPGRVEGDAFIGWNNTYVFSATGRQIPVESLANFKVAMAPLSGILQFKARGEGNFDAPSYELETTIADLYAADEGIGQVVGKLSVKDNVLTIDRLDAASNRLQVTGSGSIALNEHRDARLFFRFFETSFDPYLKFFAPQLSPYTRAIISGTVDARGSLVDSANLVVEARVDNQNARLTLFDHELRNQGDLRLAFEDNVFKINRVVLEGDRSLLTLGGTVDAGKREANLEATGQANLAILHLFYPGLNADGEATVKATYRGSFDHAELEGTANIQGGRLRFAGLPHSLSEINGPIRVAAGRITVDGVTAVIGEGPVTFGGGITLVEGYRPAEYNVRAEGRSLRLRYPPGVVSNVNVSLSLEGPVNLPMLRGQVVVLAADYRPRIDPETGLFGLAAGGALGGGTAAAPAPPVSTEPSSTPLGLDIKVISGVMPFIDNAAGRIEGRVNVDVTGTVDRPSFTGQVRIERGQWFFGENRYTVLPGTIDFSNPLRFEPYFDVEARTRARASGEAFDVTVRVRGTFEKLEPTLSSEPWLSEIQIVSLLLGGTPDIDAAALQAPNSAETARAVQTASAVLLTSPITSTLSSVVREVLPFEVVQIMPQFTNPNDEFALRQLTATARFTVGKRISERVYLTYSRNLTGDQREIILLEFDQNDRISWVLSRNEDRKFALDFRIRHVF